MKKGFLKVIVILLAVFFSVVFFYFRSIKNRPELEAEKSQAPDSVANTIAPETATAPAIHAIAIQDFAFDAQLVNINKGDSVVWTNNDSAPHTVTGNNGGPDSPTINKNGTYRFTFNASGTFSYYCAFHPSMKGIIVVK